MTVLGFDTIVEAIDRQFGITLEIADTGGGYYVLEGTMNSGQWLWISDYDAGLLPLARRGELEAQGVRIGWRLQLYPRLPGEGTAAPTSCWPRWPMRTPRPPNSRNSSVRCCAGCRPTRKSMSMPTDPQQPSTECSSTESAVELGLALHLGRLFQIRTRCVFLASGGIS